MGIVKVDACTIFGLTEGPFPVSYNRRDLLIYALGIGCDSFEADQPPGHDEMRYLYEGHPDFCAFPTYPLVLAYKGASSDVVPFPGASSRVPGGQCFPNPNEVCMLAGTSF